MATIRRAAMFASVAQYLMIALQIVKVVVISRLFTPAEIGTFALAYSLVILAQVPRVMGTWDFIVAVDKLDEPKLEACFTILMLMAVVMTGLYMTGAPLAASFFEVPELSSMIPLMAAAFLVLPLGLTTLARMNRELDFFALSVIRIAATFAEAAAAIVLAILDYGVIALAWGYVAGALTSSVLAVAYKPGRSLHKLRLRGLGDIIRFGIPTSIGAILIQLGNNLPPLILGRAMDAASVGYFTRGQSLITVLRSGVEGATAPVTQAWFAQKSRMKPESLPGGYIHITSLISGLTWPLCIYIFFNAYTLVPLLMGEQWTFSIPIAQALSVGLMMSFHASIGISLLVGTGRVKRSMSYNFWSQSARVILLVASLQFGLIAFAWALAASHLVGFLILAVFLKRDIGLQMSTLLLSLKGAAIISLGTALLNTVFLRWVFHSYRLDLVDFLILGALNGILWIIMIWVGKHPIWAEVLRIAARISNRRKENPDTDSGDSAP